MAIDQAPGEAQRLIRKIYAALTEVEAQQIGAEKMDKGIILNTASSIAERAAEIAGLLK